eukprot:UN08499
MDKPRKGYTKSEHIRNVLLSAQSDHVASPIIIKTCMGYYFRLFWVQQKLLCISI